MRTLEDEMHDTVKMLRKLAIDNRDAAMVGSRTDGPNEWYSGLYHAYQASADEIEYRLSKLECNLTTPV